MALDKAKLKAGFLSMSNPEEPQTYPASKEEAGQRFADFYADYAADGEAPAGPLAKPVPASLATAKATLATVMGAAFGNVTAAASAAAISAAVTAFWQAPPSMSFMASPPYAIGAVTGVTGTAALQTMLAGMAATSDADAAATSLANAFDAFTKTVVVTSPQSSGPPAVGSIT